VNIKKGFLNKKKKVFQKRRIYYNSWLHVYFLKNSFAGYVYASFQFSKHGGYAQKICISNFQFYCFIKKLTTVA